MFGESRWVIVPAIMVVGLFVASIAVKVAVWNECRSEGHSWPYCMSLISR